MEFHLVLIEFAERERERERERRSMERRTIPLIQNYSVCSCQFDLYVGVKYNGQLFCYCGRIDTSDRLSSRKCYWRNAIRNLFLKRWASLNHSPKSKKTPKNYPKSRSLYKNKVKRILLVNFLINNTASKNWMERNVLGSFVMWNARSADVRTCSVVACRGTVITRNIRLLRELLPSYTLIISAYGMENEIDEQIEHGRSAARNILKYLRHLFLYLLSPSVNADRDRARYPVLVRRCRDTLHPRCWTLPICFVLENKPWIVLVVLRIDLRSNFDYIYMCVCV